VVVVDDSVIQLVRDLAADLKLADRAVHVRWPHAPGAVPSVRFEHSQVVSIVHTSESSARLMLRSGWISATGRRGSSA
jgi:hypothetical protein